MDDICKDTEEDHKPQELNKVLLTGWPEDKSQVPNSALPYYNVHDELIVSEWCDYKEKRAVVPTIMDKNS